MSLNTTLATYHTAALSAAITAAVPAKVDSLSTFGPGQPISLWFQGQPATLAPADEATLQPIFTAHDPIFLSVDKTNIPADGLTAATITVSAPKPSAAPVTLLIAGTAVPVTLTNGVGTITVTSSDPAIIAITAQNPANRTADGLSIQAM